MDLIYAERGEMEPRWYSFYLDWYASLHLVEAWKILYQHISEDYLLSVGKSTHINNCSR